jgi:hypothetical protein
MELNDVVLWVFGVVMTMIGWWVRVMWEAQGALRADLSKIERQLPETYVRRDDFRDLVKTMNDTLIRIESKLDAKADKL